MKTRTVIFTPLLLVVLAAECWSYAAASALTSRHAFSPRVVRATTTTTTTTLSPSIRSSTTLIAEPMAAVTTTTTTTTSTDNNSVVVDDSRHRHRCRRLADLQQQAATVVADFRVDAFDPVPWMKNRHVQTIGGFLLREIGAHPYISKNEPCTLVAAARNVLSALLLQLLTIYKFKKVVDDDEQQRSSSFWDSRERIETASGDWFHADTKMCNNNIKAEEEEDAVPTVVLLHGLESNSERPVCKEMAQAFNQQGMNCVCLNFRGCSGQPNDTLEAYHLGFTDDLKLYLRLLNERGRRHTGPIYLAGFSLGANAVLKCLGELGPSAVTDYGVAGAAVLCAPLDLARNMAQQQQQQHHTGAAAQNHKPGTILRREIYTNNLLKMLKRRATDQLHRFCDGDEQTTQFDYAGTIAAQTLSEFDEAFIAPIYGFHSCWDYYQQSSSIFYLDKIAVPTLILNAKDDPLFDADAWPLEKSVEHGGSAPLKMVHMNHGGHLGFYFHQVAPDDERLSRLNHHHHHPHYARGGRHTPSWMASELGRFLGHVQSLRITNQVPQTQTQ